jgi:HEAT repeat protein
METKDPGAEPKASPEAAFARNLVENMVRLARLQRLYNPNNEIIKKQREAFDQYVRRYFARNDELVLRITPTEIISHGEPVYESTDRHQSYAFRMFKDGIRWITISREVTPGELERFLSILGAETAAGGSYEDLSTLLWKAELRNITYRCVKGFKEIGAGAVDVTSSAGTPEEAQVRRIFTKAADAGGGTQGAWSSEGIRDEIGYLRSLLPAGGEETDTGEGAAGIPADATVSVESIQRFVKILDAVDAEERYTPQDLEPIRELVEQEMSEENDRNAVADLARSLLSYGARLQPPRAADVLSTVAKMLGLALEMRDIPLYFTVADMIYLMLALDVDIDFEVKRQAASILMDELGGEKLRRLVLAVSSDDPIQVAKLGSFFSAFGKSLPDGLIRVVEGLEDEEEQARVEDILLRVSYGDIAFFREKLYDRRLGVVRSILRCLARMGTEEAAMLVTRAAKHPLPEIRVLALRLMRLRKEEADAGVLLEALADRDEKVRLEAVRQISSLRNPVFKSALVEKAESKDFVGLPLGEKVAVCKALAELAGKEAEPLFIRMIDRKALIRKEEVNELKIAAAEALAVIGGERAREAIVGASDSTSQQVMEAFERILRSMQ